MTKQEIEDLYIRSLDEPLNAQENEIMKSVLQANEGLEKDLSHYKILREITLRSQPVKFGPYFANKIVGRIQNVGIQIDRQILAFFKNYQLAAVGVVIALLALNAVFADQLNLQSLFGLEDTTQTNEEIVSFDFNEILNK